ncbi:Succinoglycan biosynthesis protein ExoI [compost metagenome]
MISPTLIALMTVLQVEASRPQPPVAEIAGRATAISADTIELRGERIRLTGITGPDLNQTCELQGATTRCGEQSAQQLRDAIGGEFVLCDHLEVNAAGVKVGRCWLIIPAVPSAPDLNLSRFMVRSGWAWTTPQSEYASDEEYARRSRLGLWSDPEPVEGLVR